MRPRTAPRVVSGGLPQRSAGHGRVIWAAKSAQPFRANPFALLPGLLCGPTVRPVVPVLLYLVTATVAVIAAVLGMEAVIHRMWGNHLFGQPQSRQPADWSPPSSSTTS